MTSLYHRTTGIGPSEMRHYAADPVVRINTRQNQSHAHRQWAYQCMIPLWTRLPSGVWTGIIAPCCQSCRSTPDGRGLKLTSFLVSSLLSATFARRLRACQSLETCPYQAAAPLHFPRQLFFMACRDPATCVFSSFFSWPLSSLQSDTNPHKQSINQSIKPISNSS